MKDKRRGKRSASSVHKRSSYRSFLGASRTPTPNKTQHTKSKSFPSLHQVVSTFVQKCEDQFVSFLPPRHFIYSFIVKPIIVKDSKTQFFQRD